MYFNWGILTIPKISEFNHGGSQHVNEAPHEFGLNLESLLGSKIGVELNPHELSYYFSFGHS